MYFHKSIGVLAAGLMVLAAPAALAANPENPAASDDRDSLAASLAISGKETTTPTADGIPLAGDIYTTDTRKLCAGSDGLGTLTDGDLIVDFASLDPLISSVKVEAGRLGMDCRLSLESVTFIGNDSVKNLEIDRDAFSQFTQINEQATGGDLKLASVTFPDGIEVLTLGYRAFYQQTVGGAGGSTALSDIVFPDSLRTLSIGEGAFYQQAGDTKDEGGTPTLPGSASLEFVSFPEGLSELHVGVGAFTQTVAIGDTKLAAVSFPSNLQTLTISKHAFAQGVQTNGAIALADVTFPNPADGLEIGDGAFYQFNRTESGGDPSRESTGLRSISFDPQTPSIIVGNSAFSTENSGSGDNPLELVEFPAAATQVILGRYAFAQESFGSGSNNLSRVVFPEGMDSLKIGDQAFVQLKGDRTDGVNWLSEVRIPTSLVSLEIGNQAFWQQGAEKSLLAELYFPTWQSPAQSVTLGAQITRPEARWSWCGPGDDGSVVTQTGSAWAAVGSDYRLVGLCSFAPGIATVDGESFSSAPGKQMPVGAEAQVKVSFTNNNEAALLGVTVSLGGEEITQIDRLEANAQWEETFSVPVVGGTTELAYHVSAEGWEYSPWSTPENRALAAPGPVYPPEGILGQHVNADAATWLTGVIEGLQIVKKTNGQIVETAPGPELMVGASVSWTYEVTNGTGYPISEITLEDAFTVGDGSSGVLSLADGSIRPLGLQQTELAPGETWVFRSDGIVSLGQYHNEASAQGHVIEPERADAQSRVTTAAAAAESWYLGVPAPVGPLEPGPEVPEDLSETGFGAGVLVLAVSLILVGVAMVMVHYRRS